MKKNFVFALLFALLFSIATENGYSLDFYSEPVVKERVHDYGNYPTCGVSIDGFAGFGVAAADAVDGSAWFANCSLEFTVKPLNKLYFLDAKNKGMVYVKNVFGLFAFAHLAASALGESYPRTTPITDTDRMIGGGIHFEWPTVHETEDNTYATCFFIDPSLGYDFADEQVKIHIFPGIKAAGLTMRFMTSQLQLGLDMKFTLTNVVDDRITSSYGLGIKWKIFYDFGHSRYIGQLEKEENEKAAAAVARALAAEAGKQAQYVKKQELIESYKKDYTVYNNNLYPLLLNESADVVPLTAKDENFVKNIPFGFRKDVYYSITRNGYGSVGSIENEVMQWIDRESCLYMFKISGYGYYERPYTGIAYVHFNASKASYPFDDESVLYRYTGVYRYTTALGIQNTIPMFEAVFSIGTIPAR